MKTTLAFVRTLTLHDDDIENAFNKLLAQLHHRAEALVDEHWAIIEAVAEELTERGELDGRELEDTIYRAAKSAR
jgi:hypothetical protein